MKYTMKNIYYRMMGAMVLVAGIWVSCKHKTASDMDMENAPAMTTEAYVDTIRLHTQTFHRELICNGKLKAIEKSELSFTDGGIVSTVLVHNGSYVRKGQLIAKTDDGDARLDLEKAKKELEKAKVQLADKLIGLGYDGLTGQVPADVLHRAKVSSGYYLAQYQLQAAQRAINKCLLVAPFDGHIADLDNKRSQRMDKLCTLINDGSLDVEFSILEAEVKHVHKGQKIKVSPFVDEASQFVGTVVNINPTVSEKGLIKVTARIQNMGGKLMDGMNVKVIVENDVPHALVVPKDAVVERDGYQVVFVYKDGEAVWTYVDVAYSNISSFAITGCKRKETEIHAGDVVITSGNLNLADGTQVKIKKK